MDGVKVVFLSGTGFPDAKTAYNHKLIMLGKALLLTRYCPLVISKYSASGHSGPERKSFDGIEYVYWGSGTAKGILLPRMSSHIKAFWREFIFLRHLAKRTDRLVLVTSIEKPPILMYYSFLRKLIGAKLVASIMEYHVAVAKGLASGVTARFYDHHAHLYCDGFLPISRFLADLVKRNNKQKPVLIVPVLADFSFADTASLPEILEGKTYFLLCAGTGYLETIEFAVEAHKLVKIPNTYLVLVLAGPSNQLQTLRERWSAETNVVILNALPYDELFALYASARGLLIPLREQERDEARFPQKIAEYLASASAVITNDYGEIRHYFTDGENALVVGSYNAGLFAAAMDRLAEDEKLAKRIGNKGRELGLKYFDYRRMSEPLEVFFDSLWSE